MKKAKKERRKGGCQEIKIFSRPCTLNQLLALPISLGFHTKQRAQKVNSLRNLDADSRGRSPLTSPRSKNSSMELAVI